MGTITYPHTITDAMWFDANRVVGNFNRVKDAINGQLDENNFDPAMTPTVKEAAVSEEISGSLIEPAGSLSIRPAANRDIVFRLESDPAVKYMQIDETGVRFGT